MQTIRFNPLRDLRAMERDLDKLWENTMGIMPAVTDSNAAMDMYEQDGELVVEVNLPNFTKEEVRVSTDNEVLEVVAEHTEKDESKNKRRYLVRESSNQYLRHISLPEGVNTDRAVAYFKHGKLRVVMPTQHKKVEKLLTIED